MTVVGLVRLSVPGLWADELATWGIVKLSWSDFRSLLLHTDAALAPYYLLMRGWTALVGDSDTLLRLPAVLAMAGTAGIVGRLGARVATPRVGLLAGLAFVAVPMTSRYAQEARPYAVAMLGAATATLALTYLVERWTVARALGYAASVALLGLAHPLALALLLGHAFVVAALAPRLLPRWFGAAFAGCCPVAPLLWMGYRQRVKIGWIASSDNRQPLVFLENFFGTPAVAAIVVVLGLLAVSARRPSLVPSAWALLPAAALLAVSQVAVSVWLPRYLLFVLPAWALLAGLTLARAPLPAATATLVLLAALGLPRQLVVRTSAGHDLGSREAGAVIVEHAKPGDAIIYATDDAGALWVPRDVVARYVPAARRPADVLLVHAQRTGGVEFAAECPDIGSCLNNRPRVWLVRVGIHANPLDNLGDAYETPVRGGYVVERMWQPTRLTVALLVRKR
jgi:mannosyltransferase